MADIKWIKITTDIFDDEKILLIESLPEADSIIVIWFKLLCLAGKMNNSGVFLLSDKIAYTDKMLATIFRRKESTVQLALKTFEQFGMIEILDGVITIPNWGKHQLPFDDIIFRPESLGVFYDRKGIPVRQNRLVYKIRYVGTFPLNASSAPFLGCAFRMLVLCRNQHIFDLPPDILYFSYFFEEQKLLVPRRLPLRVEHDAIHFRFSAAVFISGISFPRHFAPSL